ncbi:Protein CBG00061 [Caenorhabditis briggsae]|uniref:Protein CBG00061 n=2 Tax=Caenorhabditis briggsae TaxID=6238 RepID=A8WM82_CAEBR|nr:Protein CBG00061 [Caenorhabditis briggsae]ULT83455.1 hypothetical protein L3Y34_012589 [Caenorhabditis briggsae]CAP21586.1 Protein CBG00061 [Caenorhabditis briggsae]
MTHEVLEKLYEKIDKELGEDHVQNLVKNLMATENQEETLQNLIELHKQCCSVFLNTSSTSTTRNRPASTKKKIMKK